MWQPQLLFKRKSVHAIHKQSLRCQLVRTRRRRCVLLHLLPMGFGRLLGRLSTRLLVFVWSHPKAKCARGCGHGVYCSPQCRAVTPPATIAQTATRATRWGARQGWCAGMITALNSTRSPRLRASLPHRIVARVSVVWRGAPFATHS